MKYEILLTGDFNLPMINCSSDLVCSHNLIAEDFLDFIHDYNLLQHVYSPSRYSTCDNILDLVFSCNPNFVSNVDKLFCLGLETMKWLHLKFV